jgi:hypothetical protein
MFQDVEARERVGRHMNEERTERGHVLTRSVGTRYICRLTRARRGAMPAWRNLRDSLNRIAHLLRADGDED